MSKVNIQIKTNFDLFFFRSVAKQFLEQIGIISNDGNSIALNSNTIAIHYALDLLRNLEKVK